MKESHTTIMTLEQRLKKKIASMKKTVSDMEESMDLHIQSKDYMEAATTDVRIRIATVIISDIESILEDGK